MISGVGGGRGRGGGEGEGGRICLPSVGTFVMLPDQTRASALLKNIGYIFLIYKVIYEESGTKSLTRNSFLMKEEMCESFVVYRDI